MTWSTSPPSTPSRRPSGTVDFIIVGADSGGVIEGNKVTWANLGNYTLGSPPIQLNLRVLIRGASDDAVIRDIVDVSAELGNCTGRAAGDDLVLGSGQIEGNAITGRFVLLSPESPVAPWPPLVAPRLRWSSVAPWPWAGSGCPPAPHAHPAARA